MTARSLASGVCSQREIVKGSWRGKLPRVVLTGWSPVSWRARPAPSRPGTETFSLGVVAECLAPRVLAKRSALAARAREGGSSVSAAVAGEAAVAGAEVPAARR
jgi:hypothetical protein